MMFKQKHFKTTYSESRVSYHEKKSIATSAFTEPPNIIDIMLEPLKPNIFQTNGKINIWWILWNIGKIIGAIKAALDERANQREEEKQAHSSFNKFSKALKEYNIANGQGLLDDVGNYSTYIQLKGLEADYNSWLKQTQKFPPNA